MSRHGDNIRKQKDGRWEGRYKIDNDENGRTVYRSIYGHSHSEVKSKLDSSSHEPPQRKNSKDDFMLKDAALIWLDVNKQKNKGATAVIHPRRSDANKKPAG